MKNGGEGTLSIMEERDSLNEAKEQVHIKRGTNAS